MMMEVFTQLFTLIKKQQRRTQTRPLMALWLFWVLNKSIELRPQDGGAEYSVRDMLACIMHHVLVDGDGDFLCISNSSASHQFV